MSYIVGWNRQRIPSENFRDRTCGPNDRGVSDISVDGHDRRSCSSTVAKKTFERNNELTVAGYRYWGVVCFVVSAQAQTPSNREAWSRAADTQTQDPPLQGSSLIHDR